MGRTRGLLWLGGPLCIAWPNGVQGGGTSGRCTQCTPDPFCALLACAEKGSHHCVACVTGRGSARRTQCTPDPFSAFLACACVSITVARSGHPQPETAPELGRSCQWLFKIVTSVNKQLGAIHEHQGGGLVGRGESGRVWPGSGVGECTLKQQIEMAAPTINAQEVPLCVLGFWGCSLTCSLTNERGVHYEASALRAPPALAVFFASSSSSSSLRQL